MGLLEYYKTTESVDTVFDMSSSYSVSVGYRRPTATSLDAAGFVKYHKRGLGFRTT